MAYSPSMNIPGTDDTHLGNRWLNPKTGAFTQPDPLTQLDDPHNANAYPYAADNPANYTEPTGNFSLIEIATGLGIFSATLLAIAALPVEAPVALVLAGVAIGGFSGGVFTTCGIIGGCMR